MKPSRYLDRRELLKLGGLSLLSSPFAELLSYPAQSKVAFVEPEGTPYKGTNERLLNEIQHTAFDFFWNEASATTGQVKDRAFSTGGDKRAMSSIAATGYGLASLCIAHHRNFGQADAITERVRTTLRFLADQVPHEHGFFYHFIHMETGKRWKKCELSSVDTAILLCGILTARQYFDDQEIKDLATKIYERVDWRWMMNQGLTLSMGWMPKSGFLPVRWDHYCELMMMYLLAMGSPTHALSPATWHAWSRPRINYQGIEFISGNDPIFTHQYSHAWFDFRGKHDAYANYFDNSVKATKAHKLFCMSLHEIFPDYNEHTWGITASDYVRGYTAWGGPPAQGPIDGTIVPCAAGGSLPFAFDDCISVLRNIRSRYPQAWTRYGFVDAFNPLTGWYDKDVLGIDLGITMVMAENHRTGLIWKTFMKNPEAHAGMRKAGFRAG